MTNWYIKLFGRLLNNTVLNCMEICCANSGQNKIDHFKFRIELVQALLIEHQSGSVTKFQGHHSTDKKCAAPCRKTFSGKNTTDRKKKARPTKRCVV